MLDALHVLDGFACGEPALDEWLKRRAMANQSAGASRTFVVADEARGVIAYYALAAGAVPYRHVELAWALSYSARYHDALAELDRALRLEPRMFEAHISRGMILELLGDTTGAYAAIREAYAGMPGGADFTKRLDGIYAREGLRGVYRAWLHVSQSGRVASMPKSEVWHASLYSRIGELDSAITALERAYERHEGGLAWLRVEPSFTPLRYDARYQSLIQRVGLVN